MPFALGETKTALALLLSVSLSACATMAPEYRRLETPTPTAVYGSAESAEAVSLVSWREVFIDPALQRIIETALDNNRDLRIATLNVERARELYRVRRADLLPEIGGEAGYARQRIGENAASGMLGAPSGAGALTTEQYSVNASISAYELDLFGRVRSLNRQALEIYFAAEETRKAAEISLIAEIASAYLQLAADRELLALANDTVQSQSESLDLTQQLVAHGLGNDLDVQRARTTLERARADAAALEAQVERDENALRLLVGAADYNPKSDAPFIDDIVMRRSPPSNLHSETLLARPDVLAAENRLKAANANIGAARAAFFPKILLTARAGTASVELDDLFSGGTGVWSFAPSISVPIFTGGRNRAQLAAAKIDREIAQAEYERAIQAAFRDTADALATRRTIQRQLEATENLADAAAQTYALAEARFRNGIDGYLALLDAQRSNYAARQDLISARLAEAANVVSLYRALGGEAPAR